jgi:hypothetical protein
MKGLLDIQFRYCAQRFAALRDIFAEAIALTPLGFGFGRPVTQSNGGLLVRSYRPPPQKPPR